MAISPSQRLGPYEILSPIGAGGMGEVYRARDTRLNRTVAIKVLPERFADTPGLRERFDREAKTIASLNHPHICTLYDVGRENGTDFLVMEYIEGETLARRLTKGPLPLEQVLRYAIEIADALDKAHRKGITHRDLKPGNVMLTKSGTKLLDFGLAKLVAQDVAAVTPESQLSTMKGAITAQGTLLGTLNYMAPEQVEGKTEEIDARTDIFAFGVVVYEMATGKKAFEGKSQAGVIAAVLDRDPTPMIALRPMTPPALERVVKRCLAKERDERCQSAKDLTEELKWIAETGAATTASGAGVSGAEGTLSLGRRTLILGLGMLLLGAVIASTAVWFLKPAPPQPVRRLVINLPAGQKLAGLDSGSALALSPDGAQLAYVARRGSTQQIYLRAMDSMESRPVSGTEGGTQPFFSQDGQWLGFFADGKLKKISVSGGAVLTLVAAALPHGAAWGSQGRIVFAPATAGPLLEVSDAGGAPRSLTTLSKEDIIHGWPEFLPGDGALLFVTSPNNVFWSNSRVAIYSIGTREQRNLLSGTRPRYAPSGHLLYAQGGTLMAVPFDPRRLATTGPTVPVVEGVLQSPTNGTSQYGISDSGSLVYVPGGVQSTQQAMVWVNRKGVEQPLPVSARSYRFPRISPEGQRVAVTIDESTESHVWLYDLHRETLTRWTFEGAVNILGAWTPDGKRIAFQSNRAGAPSVFWQLADGTGDAERLTTPDYTDAPNSWSPDGKALAFIEIRPDTSYDIWVLNLGDHKAQPFLQTRFIESAPQFSPDGHWLAYVSNESGRLEIYVQPYPGPGGKWQVSTDGGTEPVWNRNGRELFYRQGDRMMAVDIATQPSFSLGKPKMLFEGLYLPTPATFPNYDVSADGQRFLMLKPVEQEQAAPTQINIVLNWFEELKQKVPTGKK